MRKLKSCGVIILRPHPARAFLLLKHPRRYDLPKGHIEPGETELECALRELVEETGIAAEQIEIEPGFRYTETYFPQYKRFGRETVEKTVVIFLGWLKEDAEIQLGEHGAYEWLDWDPPHHIQDKTIDPLLAELASYLSKND